MAAANVNALNVDPAWRPVPPSPVAMFTWLSPSPWPYGTPRVIAFTWPVATSMATMEASKLSAMFARWLSTAACAASCSSGSSEV